MTLKASDPEIWQAVQDELVRQQNTLDLIASENHVSEAILEAQSSVLTNKYAEGYPGKRYYGGCEFVDTAESIARRRAMDLFGAEYANVQPHSGATHPKIEIPRVQASACLRRDLLRWIRHRA